MKKYFKLLMVLFLGVVFLGSCSSDGSNSITEYYSTNYYQTTSQRSSSTYVSDKQKIINYIRGNGTYSDGWYMLNISSSTNLAYGSSDDMFGIAFTDSSDNVVAMYTGVLTYNSTSVYGELKIYIKNSLVFDVKYSTLISSHKYKEINSSTLNVEYTYATTDDWYKSCVAIMVNCTQACINNVSNFLSGKGLPYLY